MQLNQRLKSINKEKTFHLLWLAPAESKMKNSSRKTAEA